MRPSTASGTLRATVPPFTWPPDYLLAFMARTSAGLIMGVLLMALILLLQGHHARLLAFPMVLYMLALIPFAVSVVFGRVGMIIDPARAKFARTLRRVLGLACIAGFFVGMAMMFAWGLVMLAECYKNLTSPLSLSHEH